MNASADSGARPPIGAIVACALLGLLWLGAAVWAFTSSMIVLACIWLVVGALFDVTAALLAGRRRAAIVTCWVAVALVIGLRAAVGIARIDGVHLPGARVAHALGLALLVGLALWISRRELRETLR